jgi:phosphoserine phosphatase
MMHLMERLEIASEQILAVGDGENDICLLKAAGLSVAFRPKSRNVRAAAQFRTHRLGDVPALAGEWTRKSPSLIDDNSHIPELTSN